MDDIVTVNGFTGTYQEYLDECYSVLQFPDELPNFDED